MGIRRRLGFAFAVSVALVLAARAFTAVDQPPSVADQFTDRDVMIPVRDGVRLHARIFTPKAAAGPLPIIMTRTPYGVGNAANNFKTYLKALAGDGYIFVFEDIRGKFQSEGTFRMQR